MPATDTLRRLDAIVHKMAMVLGVLTAVAVPAAFGLVAYLDQGQFRRYVGQLSADAVGRFAYMQGSALRFADHRISEMISAIVPTEATHIHVLDAAGSEVTVIGRHPSTFVLTDRIPIIAGPHRVGQIVVEEDAWPLVGRI